MFLLTLASPLGRGRLPFLMTHPGRVSSQQNVIVDRKRGQTFPSPASFLGTKTAAQDNTVCGLENTPTPCHPLTCLDPQCHVSAGLTQLTVTQAAVETLRKYDARALKERGSASSPLFSDKGTRQAQQAATVLRPVFRREPEPIVRLNGGSIW